MILPNKEGIMEKEYICKNCGREWIIDDPQETEETGSIIAVCDKCKAEELAAAEDAAAERGAGIR